MNLRVVENRRKWWSLSLALTLAGAIAVAGCFAQFGTPLKLGLDFTGGTKLQLALDCGATAKSGGGAEQADRCAGPINAETVREILATQGIDNPTIQLLDQDAKAQDKHIVSIRSKDLDPSKRAGLIAALESKLGKFDSKQQQIDTVGPILGQQIFASGLLSVFLSLAGIVVYVSFRFQWDYAVFAIIALIHDVLITVGAFAGLGFFLGTEIDTLFVVAILTIIGFSVNDTVVIYDRVRENLNVLPEGTPIGEVVNTAVDQTLGRSINTSLSTLLGVVAIFLFGGATLRDFSLALIIGFISGAYSSIFIASTLLSWWRSRPGYVPPKPKVAIVSEDV